MAVFGHQSPDGDCLGSISAISFLCKIYNKRVDAFIDDEISKKYSFIEIDNLNKVEFDEKNYDWLISVDVASAKMLGKYKDVFLNFENTIIIDHHKNRDLIGKVVYVNSSKPSCSEIIYDIIKKFKRKIDQKTATMLYLGISDDTGCFLHDNTTSECHISAGELIKLGADFKTINYNIFKLQTTKSFDMCNLLNSQIVFDDGLT